MDTCFLSCLIAFFGTLILVIVIFILVNVCKYIGWQDVSIPEVGKFKIPPEWVVTQTEDTVYIIDKPIDEEGYKIYLINVYRKNDYIVSPYELGEDIQKVKATTITGFSNGAVYGKEEYIINGKKETKYFLDVGYSSGGRKQLHFLAWDDLIDEKTLSKIAYSFDAVKSQSPPKS